VATDAVLAGPARKKAKAFFRSTAPASAPFLDDAPKAAQRLPLLRDKKRARGESTVTAY